MSSNESFLDKVGLVQCNEKKKQNQNKVTSATGYVNQILLCFFLQTKQKQARRDIKCYKS